MKRLALIPALAMAVGLLLSAHTAEARSVSSRFHHQKTRIRHGVTSGRLTRAEAWRMRNRERMLHRRSARMRASGGGMSWAERRRMQRSMNRQSGRIYRQKHDWQRRR